MCATGVKTLLIVGPQPPSIGGSPATVQAILNELGKHPSYQAILVNTSPPLDYSKKKMRGLSTEKLRRAVLIGSRYVRGIGHSDAVLVFANNLFTLTLVPLLFLFARLSRKPFYLKPVGGDLGLYIGSRKEPLRSYLLYVLRSLDGILAQTRDLQKALRGFGCANVYYVPGCRPLPQIAELLTTSTEGLRLIFLSQITREKGAFVLLDALQLLERESSARVVCDFYGPIFEEDREDFVRQVEATASARYCGLVEAEAASCLIAGYDALILPTHFVSEGHPGVIIEAMMAGVPVISTRHGSIPDLIAHGENGLLVPVRDSRALAEAITQIALDHNQRKRMGEANFARGHEFRTDVVVPKMLGIMFRTQVE